MWDRVPIKGALPARDDGLADPEEAPLVVHSSYVQFPFKPPSAHVLHPPMVNLNVSLVTLSQGATSNSRTISLVGLLRVAAGLERTGVCVSP